MRRTPRSTRPCRPPTGTSTASSDPPSCERGWPPSSSGARRGSRRSVLLHPTDTSTTTGDDHMQQRQARVAVIGAGPSGLYAAAALVASGGPVGVDVLDRLLAPYGLVRYGVAPDYVKMKSVIRVLQKLFDPAHA